MDGPDPDYYHTAPPLRGRFRLFPVGIWRWHRYRRYFADRTCGLFVGRTRKIVTFAPPNASARRGTARRDGRTRYRRLTPVREPPLHSRSGLQPRPPISEQHLPSGTLGTLYTRSP